MSAQLQKFLEHGQLTRSRQRLETLFEEGGFHMTEEILAAMQAADPNQPFVILDGGCGVGAGIEEIVRTIPIEATRRGFHQKVEGIGIDTKPVPERISTIIRWINPDGRRSLFDNPFMGMMDPDALKKLTALRTQFIRGDVSHLPLPDESINFGYSYATLIYVMDALKALEEGFRVLKPGGVMIFNVEDRWVSAKPSLAEIFEKSPGASEAFRYQPSLIDEHDGFIIIRKPDQSSFEGFPYYLVGVVAPAGSAAERGEPPKERRDFHRSGIYKRYKKFLKVLGSQE